MESIPCEQGATLRPRSRQGSALAGARIHVLRNGRVVRIRRLMPTDAPALRAMLRRTSPESRYLRFLAPMPRVGDGLVRALIPPVEHGGAFAAMLGNRIVGVAHHGPIRAGDAEVAVLVEDDWQGLGVGRLLMARLVEEVRRRGGATVSGTVLRANHRSIALLESSFDGIRRVFDGPQMEFHAPVAATPAQAMGGAR